MRYGKLQELAVKQNVKYFYEDKFLNLGLYSKEKWNNTVHILKSI